MIWIIENDLVLLQEIKLLRLAVQVARPAPRSRFEADKRPIVWLRSRILKI